MWQACSARRGVATCINSATNILFHRTFLPTPVPCAVCAPLASVPSVPSLLPHRPPLRSTLSSRVSTSTPPSPVPVSRSCARIFSAPQSSLSTASSPTPRSTRARSTRSSSSVVPPVFPVSRSSSPTTSTVRSPTAPSTPMRLLPTVPPSRLPFSLVTPAPSLPTRSCFSMSLPSPWVSRPLVA